VQLQGAIFVLDALAPAIPSMRVPVRSELQQSVQRMYTRALPGAFEYPSFVAADADSVTLLVETTEEEKEETTDKTHEDDRGRAEALQFVVLRNKLRQAAKTLLLALAPRRGPHDGRPMSSKLD